jgi:hypothetical protein
MRWAGAYLSLLLLLAAPVIAQDEPKAEICTVEMPAEDCAEAQREAEFDKYWDEYGERNRVWQAELAYDPYFYFDRKYWAQVREDRIDDPIVSAGYVHSLGHKPPWAFSIEISCEFALIWGRTDCAPVLRIVTSKPRIEFPDDKWPVVNVTAHPKSREEMATGMAITLKWQEANLRTCKGAMQQLDALDDGSPKLWGPGYRRWLRGSVKRPETDEIIVSTDGDGIWLTANSRPEPDNAANLSGPSAKYHWEGRNGGGFAAEWAGKMLEIAKPCLKPATAPAPWSNVLIAYKQWEADKAKYGE